jgi:prolyl oligopeptidase
MLRPVRIAAAALVMLTSAVGGAHIAADADAYGDAAAEPYAGPPPATAVPTVTDPYSWLEGQYNPAALEWAKARRDRALAEIESAPAFPTVLRELRRALEIGAPLPEIFVLGNRLVRFTRDVGHPFGLLEVASRSDAARGSWRPVLDLAALNREEHSSYALSGLSFSDFPNRCLPPAFDRCLLPLSPGGSSNLELREFDLEKGAFVANGFRVPANRSFTAWLNQDTLLIAHSLDGSPALPSDFPAVVRLWRRGTPLTEAQPIFRAAPTDSLVDCRALGLGAQRRVLLSVVHDYSTVEFKLVDPSGHLTDLGIPSKVKYVGNVALSYPYVVVQFAEPATAGDATYPAESLISYNIDPDVPARQRYSSVYVPSQDSFVTDGYTGFTGTHSGIAFIVDHGLRQALWFARPAHGGWSSRELLSAAAGVTLKVDSDRINDKLLVREEGFLTPPTVGLLDLEGHIRPIQASKPVVDARDYLTEIHSARSKDGTIVDYYLVRPNKTGPGPVPTLMGGYGSFGVNYAPGYFSAELKLGLISWLSRGGAYAAAAIRGGGERGEAWHLGGAGLNKQHSFDDFIAVAEDLVRSGFTRPDKLGAFGRSAGGLLTAVMATQRSDLFKAILVGVPVTDLARMGSGSGIVRGQKAEFGDWHDPGQLASILAWSPYQNIRPGVRYPRILVITSTQDNQVGPGQARKFAARLEEVGARPLLIEEPTGGHGVPDQLRQPELVAAEVTFFIDSLMK